MDSQLAAQPLHGQMMLITRPQANQGNPDALEALLKDAGAQVIHWPLIETQTLSFQFPKDLSVFDAVVFTSQQGVQAFFSHPQKPGHCASLAWFAVGAKTQETLSTFINTSIHIPDQFDIESAANQWFKQGLWKTGQIILWPCGNIANPFLKTWCSQHQINLTPLIVYETSLIDFSEAKQKAFQADVSQASCLIFTSPSAVENFLNYSRPDNRHTIACMGSSTAQSALKHFGRCDITAAPNTLEGLAQQITQYYQYATPSET